MMQLYKQSLTLFKNHFTNDLETWYSHSRWVPSGFSDVSAIGVVNLARLTGEVSMLPSALLVCLTLGSEMVDGFEREDGTKENLTLEDLSLCIRAQAAIRTATVRSIFRRFKRVVSAGCKAKDSCKTMLRDAMYGVEEFAGDLITGDPFAPYTSFLKDEKIKVCASCLEMLDERDDKERMEIWKRLPELLGIEVPGWTNVAVDAQPADVAP